MASAVPFAASRSLLGLLLRVKLRAVTNRIAQAVDEAPVRVGATVLLVGVVWAGLYFLFSMVFAQFHRTPLEATVAMPLVFNFFFIAMLGLLAMSNAILMYGALFHRGESEYLMSAPLPPLDLVTLKYLEGLFLSSWSLVVLGLPLMMAMARHTREPLFYLLFIAFFLAFIPIPGAIGMILAWAAARFFPRRLLGLLAGAGAVCVVALIVWGMRTLDLGGAVTEVWLRSFLAKMSLVESALLPNQWVAAGIDHALEGRFYEAGMYLGVTTANAMFLSWIAVTLVSRGFSEAHDRAVSSRGGDRRAAAGQVDVLGGHLFFYLPRTLRLIAAKDLRTFFRDPLQWTQLAILFGLLVLYLANMPSLRFGLEGSGWTLAGPFLNLCAVSLILATFTCRFVYPLVSLEGQHFWMLGLLPMSRGRVLLAKLAFAMTVTLGPSLGAMMLAVGMLGIDPVWALAHAVIVISICFGLCSFAVGIGARLPMFKEQNVARIANGFGGTINLLASLALISVVLTGVGIATWRSYRFYGGGAPDGVSLLCCAGAALISIGGGATALALGAKHLARVEL